MSMTHVETASGETTAYGGAVDAVGGIATIVLAIVALAGLHPDVMVPVAVIVFGAALLIQGGTMLSEYGHVIFPTGAVAPAEQFGGGGLSALFLVGASGIVLGVLSLLGIAAATLTSVAIIAFGGAMILSSGSVRHLYQLRSSTVRATRIAEGPGSTMTPHWGTEMLAGEMASDSAGIHLLSGLTAVVLGILAVAGTNPMVLSLCALIVLGATVILTGSELTGMVLGFMRPWRTAT
jgi:hypothetical protein